MEDVFGGLKYCLACTVVDLTHTFHIRRAIPVFLVPFRLGGLAVCFFLYLLPMLRWREDQTKLEMEDVREKIESTVA